MQADVLIPQDDVLRTASADIEVSSRLAGPLHIQSVIATQQEWPLLCQVSVFFQLMKQLNETIKQFIIFSNFN